MRPSVDAWAMELASVTAKRSTCLRRAVGCVLLDKDRHVLATGYNGVAAGMPHCNETKRGKLAIRRAYGDARPVVYEQLTPYACPGASAPSGTNLEGCEAIHAEQNALLQCRDVRDVDTVYVTASPCVTCTKLLLNTGAQRIVYLEEYPAPGARELWERAGRVWERFRKAYSA